MENPGKIILVGPRYPLLYGPDGVHLTNEGYRLMGEYHAKAYHRVVVEHGVWEPLRPAAITRAGAVIKVKLIVPSPPLVLDTVRAIDPGHMGFEYVDDGPTTPTIASVGIASADTVEVTLSAAPTGANGRLRYAYTGALGAKGGLQDGRARKPPRLGQDAVAVRVRAVQLVRALRRSRSVVETERSGFRSAAWCLPRRTRTRSRPRPRPRSGSASQSASASRARARGTALSETATQRQPVLRPGSNGAALGSREARPQACDVEPRRTS